jgi:hypothetical protein|tara:strand:+ start:521 stop:811 length:291 start_codon:yes stop_codon:yes gene_type:complete
MALDALEMIDELIQDLTRGSQPRSRLAREPLPSSREFRIPELLERPQGKKKRKVSKYQREFGRQLKLLKAKHPRTPVTKLMKRAHTATKKQMRRKK